MKNKCSVLVTGGLGFVGSAICKELVTCGVNLIVLDNRSRGTPANLDGLQYADFNVDIRDYEKVNYVFQLTHPDIIIHLAAMHFIPDCNKNPASCLEINVVGTENILTSCRQHGVKRVVITSSMAVYPIKNTSNQESDQAVPFDVYGESKYLNELQAGRFQRETNIDTIAVRLSNVYGPRETNPHVIPEIMAQILSGKENINLGNIKPKRDFIYTDDVAQAYCTLATNQLLHGFYTVNLGSGKEYSIHQMLQILSKLLGREIKSTYDPERYRSVERMHLLADISKIKSLTDWEPKISFTEGLRRTCRWYGITTPSEGSSSVNA